MEVLINDAGRRHLFALHDIAISTVIIGCLSIAYFFVFHFVAHGSDEANPLISGYEMFHGNPLLRGWQEAASTFYGIDLVLMGLLTLIFGLSPKILTITPAIFWALTVWYAMRIAARFAPPDRSKLAVVYVFIVLGLPPLFSNNIIPFILCVAPIHIGAILFGVIVFILARKHLFSSEHQLATLVGLAVVLVILTMSDPFSPFFCALPLLLTSLTVRVAEEKKKYVLILVTLFSLAVGKLMLPVIALLGGFQASSMPATFVKFDDLSKNISLLTQGLLAIFGTSFFGKEIGLAKGDHVFATYLASGPLVSLVRIPFVVLLCALLARSRCAVYALFRAEVRSSNRSTQEPLHLMLFWSITIVLTANIFSNLLVNVMTTRYVLPVYIFGAIFLAINVAKFRFERSFLVLAFAISAVSLVCGYLTVGKQPRFADDETQQLTLWLRANSLTEGYAPYWSASIVTAISAGTLRVRALAPDGSGKIVPFRWIANDNWYKPSSFTQRKRFVVVDNVSLKFPIITESQVVETLGPPEAVQHVGKFTINVYDANHTDFSNVLLAEH
jgi:hypothetical protein